MFDLKCAMNSFLLFTKLLGNDDNNNSVASFNSSLISLFPFVFSVPTVPTLFRHMSERRNRCGSRHYRLCSDVPTCLCIFPCAGRHIATISVCVSRIGLFSGDFVGMSEQNPETLGALGLFCSDRTYVCRNMSEQIAQISGNNSDSGNLNPINRTVLFPILLFMVQFRPSPR